MALAINTNMASIGAQRQLQKSTNALGKTFERLSSGLRINRAADDAAGMSIATRMTAQVRGTNQAIRNSNDAISAVQVAEGALDETNNALQRIRELAVQGANDTLIAGDREDLQREITQLVYEVQRISSETEFNNQRVVNGSFATKKFHVGPDGGQTIAVTVNAASVRALGVNSTNAKLYSATMTATQMQSMANGLIGRVDSALDSVSDIRSNLGSYQNRFEAVIANLSSIVESTQAARSRILDADIASETANLTRNAILQQAGTAILAQANQQPQIALQLLG
ncbi:MAG: flagellin FliC [Magnetococcales bacterium]|nr:flagellin FliC [Magnetococcales bacterium]MBF0150834.1 flagellin FliC [Magnetococcales bacterium]MBF0173313.1 flagellin FliC [Magnetococcales bacterium]MBF0346420.1 flagellin FliC [Magnetococcales bacterium]MBF0630790.1 flagellin FliC [Magnetococcales bacterium]